MENVELRIGRVANHKSNSNPIVPGRRANPTTML